MGGYWTVCLFGGSAARRNRLSARRADVWSGSTLRAAPARASASGSSPAPASGMSGNFGLGTKLTDVSRVSEAVRRVNDTKASRASDTASPKGFGGAGGSADLVTTATVRVAVIVCVLGCSTTTATRMDAATAAPTPAYRVSRRFRWADTAE